MFITRLILKKKNKVSYGSTLQNLPPKHTINISTCVIVFSFNVIISSSPLNQHINYKLEIYMLPFQSILRVLSFEPFKSIMPINKVN
jgi:hypothetical protein